jgi:hypothetical protein
MRELETYESNLTELWERDEIVMRELCESY